MPLSQRARTIGITLVVAAAACAVPACTHDFAAFDPGGDATPAEGDAAADGPGRDSSAGTDAASSTDAADAAVDADAGCSAAAACVSKSTVCATTCDSTFSTCNGGCGGSKPCKDKCTSDRDACMVTCTSTCKTCAGAACASGCK